MLTRRLALVLPLALGACAARVPHTQPEDMSAAEHRREAAHHEAQAELAARRIEQRDHAPPRSPGASYTYYWDTERWREQVEGEEHLAAAQALEREYTFACALVSEEEQARSPIDRSIDRVVHIDGAVLIHLDASAGAPAPLLHRLRCHRARMAFYGLDEMQECPLGVPGLAVHVRATATGVDVTLTARDPAALAEVERRARALLARRRGQL
jgi:hypothetical protein